VADRRKIGEEDTSGEKHPDRWLGREFVTSWRYLRGGGGRWGGDCGGRQDAMRRRVIWSRSDGCRIKRARLSYTIPPRPAVDGRTRRRGIYSDTTPFTHQIPQRTWRPETTL